MPSLEDVLKKEVFRVKDIQVIFQCGAAKAYKIIRAIQSVSNILGFKGAVHKKDYEKYINREI